jgi:hypothetical protein
MNKAELFIGEIGDKYFTTLDLDSNFDIALQYSIADVKDITKRNSAFSKTITLPGTKNNNYTLGNLFDVKSDFRIFNPNKKTPAKLLINSQVVIDGFLQLRNIVKETQTNHEGNEIRYEVVIYDNTIDLMTELGEKTLSDLDLSRFNHTYNLVTIVNSWQHTWEQGYVYPLYGNRDKGNFYRIEEMHPSVFSKMILLQILEEAGYGFKGSFIEENKQFEREIIAYTGDGAIKIGEDETKRRKFRAGIINDPEPFEIIGERTQLPITPLQPVVSKILLDTEYPFNDVSTPPNFDNAAAYDIVNHEWVCDASGEYSFELGFDFNYIFTNDKNFDVSPLYDEFSFINIDGKVKFEICLEFFENNQYRLWPDSDIIIEKEMPEVSFILEPNENITLNVKGSKTTDVRRITAGTRVRTRIKVINIGSFINTNTLEKVDIPTKLSIANTSNNFLINVVQNNSISQGDDVNLKNGFDKIKQKDVIIDLIRRYNLFIQVDPDNKKIMRFETRDEFFEIGGVLDWTDKKDFSQSDKIEILSDLQFKELLFTWKEDRDEINELYTAETGEVYGQQKFIFDNDFVKGEKKIESPFSPTPLIETAGGLITPALDPTQPKGNPRILYWAGLRETPNNAPWFLLIKTPIGIGSISFPIPILNGYPYAGHLDDPVNPTLDINFGKIRLRTWRGLNTITDNNMFNKYWSNYVEQLTDGKLVKSKIYLTEVDVNFIKNNFNTKIFIKDSYYFINRIIDYKPLENRTTEVELLKIKDGVRWNDKTSSIISITTPALPGIEINGGGERSGNRGLILGEGNLNGGVIVNKEGFIQATNQAIIGNNNEVRGDSSVIGDNNFILDKSFIIGDNNRAEQDSYILGNNNILNKSGVVLSGDANVINSENSLLIGSFNITANDDNKIYIGNEIKASKLQGLLELSEIKFDGVSKPFNTRRYYLNQFVESDRTTAINNVGDFEPVDLQWGVNPALEGEILSNAGDFEIIDSIIAPVSGFIQFLGDFTTLFKVQVSISGVSLTAAPSTPSIGDFIEFRIFKRDAGGTLLPLNGSTQWAVSADAGIFSLNLQCFVEMSNSDDIQLYVKNNTQAGVISISYLNLIMTEIDT